MTPGWYLRRLRRMTPSEIAGRFRDRAAQVIWQFRPPDVRHESVQTRLPTAEAKLKTFPASTTFSGDARQRVLDTADEILRGEWRVFGRSHPEFGQSPDWFVDARSGQRALASDYAFDIRHRDETRTGNIKYIWEPSRHHHLTVLAAAYAISQDERYAERIAAHLSHWWRENPFLRGPHWISGIEIAIRLISWTWIRQLLANWLPAKQLFEDNPDFIAQLYGHQIWLAQFPSRGSSANNHIIAEAAGQFVASCAFPLFRDSADWRVASAETLKREVPAQTFACGLNRELATDYHGFVLELLLAAAIQGAAAGHDLDEVVWTTIGRMTDVIAAMLDEGGQPPRQGDADDGIGLLLDSPDYNRWKSLLATGAWLFGPMPWWPKAGSCDLRTLLLTAELPRRAASWVRPTDRPCIFPEAGQVFLRAGPVWCRTDHGPHGLGGIAAHAHADALSLEYRVAEVEILADPGTYCYHGDRAWREYFRSTAAHNTLELFSRNQSISGGPFLWTQQAQSRVLSISGLDESEPRASWRAEHTGYVQEFGLVHRRSATLSRENGHLRVKDVVIGDVTTPASARLSWHLGPQVDCKLVGHVAHLSWPGGGSAELRLPAELSWSMFQGSTLPIAGWYSQSFDVKSPAVTLSGVGDIAAGMPLVTELILSGFLSPGVIA